jgi:tight adherence protein B
MGKAETLFLTVLSFFLASGAILLFGLAVRGRSVSRKEIFARLSTLIVSRNSQLVLPIFGNRESELVKHSFIKLLPLVPQLNVLCIRTGNFSLGKALGAIAISILTGLFTGVFVFKSILLAAACAALFAAGPVILVAILGARRRERIKQQLPDALDFLSRALRAGHSINSAINMIAEEMSEPIGVEFRKVFEEINFGIPFKDALSNLSSRLSISEIDFFVTSLVIQRESGGNLTEVLGNLAHTIRERIKLLGQVRVLASEGKFSGILIGILPVAMAAALTAINPQYMKPLWSTTAGNNLIIIGICLMIAGFIWMWKITQVKV